MKPLLKNSLAAAVGAAIAFNVQASTDSLQAQDKLVIAASKADVTVEDFAGTVSVVSAAEIQLSGARNILEAIETLPGVTVSQTGSGRNGISIRGMETNHTLILVDGRRVSDTDTNVPFSDFQFNWVPMTMIERIEVIRGPVSNLYGSAALGGVINIITKKASDKWTADISGRGGAMVTGEQGDEQIFNIAAAGPINDRIDLALSMERRDEDAFRDSFNNGSSVASRQGKEILNATADLGIALTETDHLNLSLITGSEDRFVFPNTADYQIDRRQMALDYDTRVQGFDLKTRLYRSETDNRLPSSTGHRNRDLTEDVISIDLGGELNASNYLSAGVEYSREEYDQQSQPAATSDFSDEFRSGSLFVQDRTAITDDISITWGARYDDHQRFGSEVSPKLYLNWVLNDHWQLKTGYGEGFKAPAVREASAAYEFSYGYPTGPGSFRQNIFLGNGNLKPEVSETVELGAIYRNDRLSGGFTLFNNDVENLIQTEQISSVTSGTTTTVTNQYRNVANARITGLEAELGYAFNDDLDGRFNITLIDHEDRDTGNHLTDRSEVEANLVVTHELPVWGLQSRLAWKYTGKQYTDAANADEVPAHDTVDITFRKALGNDVYAQVGIYNLFNELAAEKDDDGDHSETGRLVSLTLSATF